MCSQLMFIHAMTGSDTTSRIFGVGKKAAFQYLAKGDHVLRSCVTAFTIPNQTTKLIDNLGCQAMAVLFGGNGTDSLATMRYNIFSQKFVSASSCISPERLPPTESATKLHFRSWSGQEKRRVWIPGTGRGTCKTIGSSQLCQRWMLLQTICWKSYTATARLPAKHCAALVEGMDYHVQLSVDRAKLKNVTIHRTGFSQRSRKMMMNKY